MKKIAFAVFFISTFILAADWDNVKYSYTTIPNTNDKYVEKKYKGVTYNVYTVIRDKSGKRSCTQNKQAKEHAIFLGCSLVFGDGVENKDTIPQLFQDFSHKKYQAYNYGYCGDGPNNTLLRLERVNLSQEIPEAQGVCFYLYPVRAHAGRVRLHSDSLWAAGHPYYELRKGLLVHSGTLKQRQFLLYGLLQVYNWLPVPEGKRTPLPKYPTDKDYNLIADILCGVQEKYTKQFNSGKIYVVIAPYFEMPTEEQIQILKDKGLKIIVLDKLDCVVRKNLATYTISSWDGHYNAKMNKLIAKALVDQLKELEHSKEK